jgi:REP element-mobilizing transposase RayT
MNDVIRGVLARAARRAGLAVHAPVFLSNHYHLLVSVTDAQQLAEFTNYLNSNLAREAGRLVRWREKFWGRRFQAVIVSDEEEAQVARLWRTFWRKASRKGSSPRPSTGPGSIAPKP